jgi:hypothetical protein
MGRRTYEVGLKIGLTSPYGHLAQYLFSRTMAASPDPSVELLRGDPPSEPIRTGGQPDLP